MLCNFEFIPGFIFLNSKNEEGGARSAEREPVKLMREQPIVENGRMRVHRLCDD
jgi:hypothetical protein